MGDDYKGYIFRITGGNDKQGFTMKQGILIAGRSRILFKKRGTTYRPRRSGERKRKSVRGCITGPDLAVIALRVIAKGDKDIDGVTNVDFANRLGRKRRNRIIKAFALDKKVDDVRKYVVRREQRTKGDKTYYKSAHIQRMITETRLRRKKQRSDNKIAAVKSSQEKSAAYEKLLKEYFAEKRAQHKKAEKKEDK
jgi:small subunit ribosomal protein S6e